MYEHKEADLALRPEVGTQSQFRKKKEPVRYRYDSSMSPALDWDGQNGARELGEWLIARIEEAAALPAPHQFDKPQEFVSGEASGQVRVSVRNLKEAVDELKRLGGPFLTWAGKAERLSFDVPTLPLFVHERLSTKAIIETLKAHKRDKQLDLLDLFGDPQHDISDQVLRAYEYRDKWVNRMVLGDSLVVMNSLLHYEGLGGQVQMIYMDPPYGVKFGSNFQPFIRKRDVKHNEDGDLTREPEMVKAYRDTWELGLHSYLTYMRDRLLLSRDLLTPSGSVFVQISNENLHHVRELMDEVFGAENFCSVIAFRKTSGFGGGLIDSVVDYLLWYAKDKERVKYNQLFTSKTPPINDPNYRFIELLNGDRRQMTKEERSNPALLPKGTKIYRFDNITSDGVSSSDDRFVYNGEEFRPGGNLHWKTTMEGMQRLLKNGRIEKAGRQLSYIRFFDDFAFTQMPNVWDDTATGGFGDTKFYVVQTTIKTVARSLLMTTDPGDLVLDPTCGSGTTAYVAEQWGRRWITIDTSRVPLALARQRLLTATFPFYALRDESRGPAGGFTYVRKQNARGEEVGGIVPHIMLESIAKNEPPAEEVLVDRPEVDNKITRVTGPFCFEATIPTPVDWEGDGIEDSGAPNVAEYGPFVERMLEVLRQSPVLHLDGKKTVTLKNVRPPAKTLSLSAEAVVSGYQEKKKLTLDEAVQEADEATGGALPFGGKTVAIVFGPENGAVSEKLVYEAAREAHAKNYSHLYVIGFAIQSNARKLIDESEAAMGVPATYVQATPDLMMGDLLKNMRSSQIFSVCGLPEVKLHKIPAKGGEPEMWQVELLGMDVFDPITMETDHRKGDDVPAWFLDTNYNNMCFHVGQAFFPRTSAWDGLKRALKATYEEGVWDHLAGTKSAPFEAGEHGQIAVKVIDDRGNELMVVKALKEAK